MPYMQIREQHNHKAPISVRTDGLAGLSDRELGQRAEGAVKAAASALTLESYHAAVDAIRAECVSRDRGIYQRASNRVARSQGRRPARQAAMPTTGP